MPLEIITISWEFLETILLHQILFLNLLYNVYFANGMNPFDARLSLRLIWDTSAKQSSRQDFQLNLYIPNIYASAMS